MGQSHQNRIEVKSGVYGIGRVPQIVKMQTARGRTSRAKIKRITGFGSA